MEITRAIPLAEISLDGEKLLHICSKALGYAKAKWLQILAISVVSVEIILAYLFYGITVTEGTLIIWIAIFYGSCGLMFVAFYPRMEEIRQVYNRWILNRWICTLMFISLFTGMYLFLKYFLVIVVYQPWMGVFLIPTVLFGAFMQMEDKKSSPNETDEYTGMSLTYSRSLLKKKNKQGGQNKQEEQNSEYKVHEKTLVMIILILTINMVVCVYAWTSIYKTAEEMLWNPLLFCGMPSYALGNGVVWFNNIINYQASFKVFLFKNTVMFFIVWGLVFWANMREEKKKPLTIINVWIIIADFLMLISTNFE